MTLMRPRPPKEKVAQALREAAKLKKPAFNPVLRERDMKLQARDDGAHDSTYLEGESNQ